MSKARSAIDVYGNYAIRSEAIGQDIFKKALLDAKARRVRLRYTTRLTNDNLQEHKELIKRTNELRHIDEIKGKFVTGDKNECETMFVMLLPCSYLLFVVIVVM